MKSSDLVLDDLQSSLLSSYEVSSQRISKKSKFIVFWKWAALYLKLRWSPVTIVLTCISAAVAFVSLAFPVERSSLELDDFSFSFHEPSVYLSCPDIQYSFSIFSPEYKNIFITPIFYPNNEFFKYLTTTDKCSYKFERSYYYYTDNQTSFEQLKSNITNHSLYDISRSDSSSPFVEIYYPHRYQNSYFESSQMQFFKRAYSNFTNGINFNSGSNTFPRYYSSMGLITMIQIFINVPIMGYFILAFNTVLEMQEQRTFLLLTISGASELLLWLGILIPEIITMFLYSLIVVGINFFSKLTNVHSFGLTFLLTFFSMIAFMFMMLSVTLLFKKAKHYKFVVLIFIIITVFWVVFPIFGLDPNSSKDFSTVFTVCSYFFPNDVIAMNFGNMGYLEMLNLTLSLETANIPMFLSTSQLFGVTFCSIFIYLFFFIFILLFFPRAAGIPPIGFRNMFSAKHWKKLFIRKNQNLLENPNFPFLSISHLSKTYKGSYFVHALDDVSFDVNKNEIIVLIGPNGCGKSTLLNTMTGVIDNDCGTLNIYGQQSILGFAELQSFLGICFQDNVLFEKLSVLDHLRFFGSIRGASEIEINNEISVLSQAFDMVSLLPLKAKTLSGGQKRKLCIAIAFMGNPQIVILDEPTAGIDVTTRQLIWKAISLFKNTTCFVTTHSLEEAETVSSRLFVMKAGQVIFTGTSSQLRKDFHCGYRISTIGEHVNMQSFLSFCQSKYPSAAFDDERSDSVLLPVDDSFADFLESLQESKNEFGIDNFTVTIEQLEHVILRLIADEE